MINNPIRPHWFFVLAPLVLAADLYVGLSARGEIDHYKTVFKSGSVDEAISRAPADIPKWMVRLLAIEANFWRKLWGALKRLLNKR